MGEKGKKRRKREGGEDDAGAAGPGGAGGAPAPPPRRQRYDALGLKQQRTKARAETAARRALGKGVADRKLRANARESALMSEQVKEDVEAAQRWLLPAEAGVLEAEDEMERTYRVTQEEIVRQVDVASARKVFDLRMEELGPYSVELNASGRFALVVGRKGHLALMDWKRGRAVCEVQARETSRAGCFLHNETFFCVAQKRYCYIYDKRGLEVHCLKEHTGVRRLEFLRRHFLLASAGDAGVLRYQDTSTGQQVAATRTRLGPCSVLAQNAANAVLCLGHGNGSVTMWSPTCPQGAPLVRVLCHRGPLTGVAVDRSGTYMATCGSDSQVKIWDVRSLRDEPVQSYFSRAPPAAVHASDTGMLAVAYGSAVQVWRDAFREAKQPAPYMTHRVRGKLESVRFCPFEDVLLCGHAGGVSSMLVPGSGEPNFDSLAANPYQTRRQRREAEVHQLLDKLAPEMIMLDPDAIGTVGRASAEEQAARAAERAARARDELGAQRARNEAKAKMKGKNRPTRRYRKRQDNVYDDKKAAIEAAREARDRGGKAAGGGGEPAGGLPSALLRFAGRG